MAPSLLRWLHLSDFHTGKDDYDQRQLFQYILENVQNHLNNKKTPDIIFITGDLANKGQTSEYDVFADAFLLPLMELLGDEWPGRIFTIPGNHDVDRSRAKAVQRYDILGKVPTFLDPTEQGRNEREPLFARFSAYTKVDLSDGGKWITSSTGAFVDSFDIRGCKIGVLCLNTAWLSESDDDRYKLSPGKGIVEAGLEALKKSDVRIVLGHHPLDWFIDDDIDSIRTMFGKNKVIYLHGHLHKNQSRQAEGLGHSFITLQAGACFQPRENEHWINRILWCELQLEEQTIQIEPLLWSKSNQEWSINSSAFPKRYRKPGTEYWILPLPGSQSVSEPNQKQYKISLPDLPIGWSLVDEEMLRANSSNIDDGLLLQYFDGRAPGWEEALSPKIPKRAIVYDLEATLNHARQKGETQLTLLLGAGGEGKSTALLQTVCSLAKDIQNWNVIWHNDTDSHLPVELLLHLPRSKKTWLIVSDDGDLIAKSVFDLAKAIRISGRKDFQFLLCCRDTDWIGANADQLPWKQYTSFIEKRLRGLSLEDAELIVSAWGHYGKQGLGKLDGVSIKDAAKKLVEQAKSEKYQDEGAFLGAMLRTRFGEDFKAHIKDLLSRLNNRDGLGGSLLNAFAYIAVMHADNNLFLSKEVLAEVLGGKPGDIKRQITEPLGQEAAVMAQGYHILTRHRAIAEVARDILSSAFYFDFDEIYIDLTRAAIRIDKRGEYVQSLKQWRYLSTDFFNRGNIPLGIKLAHAATVEDPSDPFFIVHLASLLRKAREYEKSVDVFRAHPNKPNRNVRPYLYEWATSEGKFGNVALAAWLTAMSIADKPTVGPPDNQRAMISLEGLAINLRDLFKQYKHPDFLKARNAVTQIGLMLNLDSQAQKYFQRHLEESREAGIGNVDVATAITLIQSGLRMAWERREADLPEWVKYESDLTFRGLIQLLKSK